MVPVILFLFVSLQTVLAHFTLNYPATRGFNEDLEPSGPCGGFDMAGKRTQFPLSGGFLEIYSGHTSYSYTINVITGNSTDFANGVQVATGSRAYPELSCLSIDLSKSANIKDGVNGTIQIIYNGGDGLLYQCADVVFQSSPTSWNSSMCVNADGSATSSNQSNDQHSNEAASITATFGLMLLAAIFVSYTII